MLPLTERDIRGSFVNCSKGEAKRLPVPRDLDRRPWEDLDFFGWNDPTMPGRGYLVIPQGDELIGIALRYQTGKSGRAQMCTICLTTHGSGGVSLLSAAKIGDAGRRGDTIGTYMCTDLACPLYARNKRRPSAGNRYQENLTSEEKAQRVVTNIGAFVAMLGA
ncbi:FBP domain-containing protein [Rhodococcus sp. IEGM 1379]|uniref:FBP domain-containing protein n=1 Tax=Rhodococcus sp. IEGM 1379 TaxID=3047086 RepID=UPI0024B70D8D|nr:FBP domain-containing protein [Rhodococcus sp. IEGM 1379]MDI9915827.1 FBP domain-containing protein [Rhodococcus sp. IEGM 1379]